LQILFLLPFFISLYYVARNRVDKAFLNVYLPCIFLVPTYYTIRLPHMPEISPGSAALIPIGIALLFRPKIRWRFRRMDLWVLIFMVSIGLSETLREGDPRAGMLIWMQDFIEMFLAYIVGRQVIEPDLRLETVKRTIFLFVCQTPMALWEFRMGANVWQDFGRNVFGVNSGWILQHRGGTTRIATCFAHAILAGMLFVVALTLNNYLVQIYKQNKTRLGPRMSQLQKYRVPFFVLLMMLYMTGSRMPMTCLLVSFLFMQIPRFKNIRTGVIVIVLTVGIGGSVIYSLFQKYTTTNGDVTDEAQSSAIYRKELLVNYAPAVEEGGWLGWGMNTFPRVPSQFSIDNDYLILQLAQGQLGEYSFLLLAFESILTLGICAMRFKSRESLFLVFALLGALIGTFVALSTVALFEQVVQVLFLMLGWSQSLQDTSPLGVQVMSTLPEPKFRFKRVIA
jgi:hypothetical protein